MLNLHEISTPYRIAHTSKAKWKVHPTHLCTLNINAPKRMHRYGTPNTLKQILTVMAAVALPSLSLLPVFTAAPSLLALLPAAFDLPATWWLGQPRSNPSPITDAVSFSHANIVLQQITCVQQERVLLRKSEVAVQLIEERDKDTSKVM
jgi:hypothetical protein